MTAPAGYKQLPSGFWVRDDGSGPYFVDTDTGDALRVGGGGYIEVTAAQFSALVADGTLIKDAQYYVTDGPARWVATGGSTYDGISFLQGGILYVGDQAYDATTEVDLPAGTLASAPTTGFDAGIVYYRRMTDVGTVPGGTVQRWLGGTSTAWLTPDRQAPHLGLLTAAEMLAATPTLGRTCDVSDIGNIVSSWYANGTCWVPRNGEQKVYSLMADTYNTTADGTERVNTGCQVSFPGGLFAIDGMGFKLIFAAYKSGAAESPVVAIKFGANGTIADTVMSGSWTMATTNRQLAQTLSAKRASSSTLQAQGAGAVTATGHRFGNQTSGARVTALSGLSFSAATYLSMTVQRTTPFAEYMLADVFDVWVTGR